MTFGKIKRYYLVRKCYSIYVKGSDIMDFFDMYFNKLFLEKHWKNKFDKIVKQINAERREIGENSYIELIFKIAFLDFFMMTEEEVQALIADTMKYQNIDIEKIKKMHKKSIEKIQEYLKNNMEKIRK